MPLRRRRLGQGLPPATTAAGTAPTGYGRSPGTGLSPSGGAAPKVPSSVSPDAVADGLPTSQTVPALFSVAPLAVGGADGGLLLASDGTMWEEVNDGIATVTPQGAVTAYAAPNINGGQQNLDYGGPDNEAGSRWPRTRPATSGSPGACRT